MYIATSDSKPDTLKMGGKAGSLAKLNSEFNIPHWFVVTPDAFDSNGLIEAARSEIENNLSLLGDGLLAVRSSAVDEDGADSSFAGQLESYLNIHPDGAIDAVIDVYKSAFTESVMAYRKERGIEGSPNPPAVLIQSMVKADYAGVVFSVNPVEGRSDQVVVMATAGLADKLVSGEVNGDAYHLSREGTIVSSELVNDEACLSSNQLNKITKLAIAAEKHFGSPQDVEWAIAGDELFTLQSRPITTLNQGEPTIWDNSNIVESYSGIVSPLTFSFASYVYAEVYIAFSRVMGVSKGLIDENTNRFENMLGYINGRVYYNLLNWYRVLRLFPGFSVNRGFMEQMMGVKETLPDHIAESLSTKPATLFEKSIDLFRLVRTLFRLLYHAVILPYTVKRFTLLLDGSIAKTETDLAKDDLTTLGKKYRNLEKVLLSHWDAPLINDFLCMIAFGASRKALLKWCGEEMGGALHNDLMIGQGEIVSAEPAKMIKRMAKIVDGNPELIDSLIAGDLSAIEKKSDLGLALSTYLDKFGDRCAQELKLESITISEDPTPILQAIGFMASNKTVDAPTSEAPSPYGRLKEEMSGGRIKYYMARSLISWTKKRIRDRENLRFERTRIFGLVRRIFLYVGDHFVKDKLINNRRDIFYLTVSEVMGIIEGTSVTYNIDNLVAVRKSDAKVYETKPDPPTRFTTYGAVFSDFKDRDFQTKESRTGGDQRIGQGCCRGVVRAKVRVVKDPRTESLNAGEILVARHTDPGWIALFSNASGIIVERGSLLSHSAIVAREMGIPAIVAIDDLLTWLSTGDMVEIDGSTGVVMKVNPDE